MNNKITKQIVAIVGRPNVGKSTLFNRLSGSNLAIVDDKPGVTRDRNYIDCIWNGVNFLLTDTGGMDPNNKTEIFTMNTLKQVNIAIEEARVIIFVVDASAGIHPIDQNVADVLRKSNKNIILVINKIDFKEQNKTKMYEFSKLGFREIIEISASHGINIGDLLDKVVSYLSAEHDDIANSKDLIKIAIVGKPNVGKSSLTNFILGEERSIVTDIPGTTRDSIHSYFSYGEHKIMLVDTAGIRKRSKIHEDIEYYSVNRTFKAIENSEIVLLLVDATTEISEQDEKLAGFIEDKGKACILVVNKWDLVAKTEDTVEEYTEKIHRAIPFLEFAPIVFISAMSGFKVPKLMELIPKVYTNYCFRVPTNSLNKSFREILLEKKPVFDKLGGNNKLQYITQVGTNPPAFAIFSKGAGNLQKSYLRYLKNKFRTFYDFQGVPLRIKVKKTTSTKEEIKKKQF